MIIPAIDVLNESIVRLYQGDFEQSTDYTTNLMELMKAYQQQGAPRIHFVDLSRAKNPEYGPSTAIQVALSHARVPIQVGGGIRTEEDIKQWLSFGVQQVVLGSIAVTDRNKVKQWIQFFGAKTFVLSLDVKMDSKENRFYPYIHGWQQRAPQDLNTLIRHYYSLGIRHLLCTDIQLDGTLQGPNQQLYQLLTQNFPELRVQASGGVGKLSDIDNIKDTGASGLIIGKALLEKRFSVQQAIERWNARKISLNNTLNLSQQEPSNAR